MIRPIQSSANDNFKVWQQLSTAKGIRKHGQFFLMGEKLIAEFLRHPNFKILAELLGPQHQSLLEGRDYDRTPRYQLSKPLFNEVDVVGTHHNLLLLELPELSKGEITKPRGLELILPLGDPSNLGAAIRSARAFGVKKIYVTEEAALPFHPKAIKASAGASLQMTFQRLGALRQVLGELDPKHAFVLDNKGQDLKEFSWPDDLHLVVGEEGPGLPPHALPALQIRTEGVESLNASVAVSLACFSFKNR